LRFLVITGKRAVRHVVFHTNYWKSFVPARPAADARQRARRVGHR